MSLKPRYTLVSNWLRHARKVVSFWRATGFRDGFAMFRQLKEIQYGELKGVDRYGNAYYESDTATPGRNRWVVYPSRQHVNASAVPAEWHGWLHYMVAETPIERPPPQRVYGREHQAMTLSGQGAAANYLPPGHVLSTRHATFGRTGEGAADDPDGSYENWKRAKEEDPEREAKWAVKTERR